MTDRPSVVRDIASILAECSFREMMQFAEEMRNIAEMELVAGVYDWALHLDLWAQAQIDTARKSGTLEPKED